MKRWLAMVLLVLVPAWAALPAQAADVRVAARESVALDFPGAITAFAVDPSTVEVSAQAGQVLLLGRRAGRTLVTVVLPGSVEILQVLVDPPVALMRALDEARRRDAGRGFWEARYDSGLHRFTGALSANFGQGERTARLRLEGVRQPQRDGDRGISALPVASLEIESPGRSVVLLDKFVQSSPLTLDGVVLRGFHLREGALEVHAGKASTAPLEDLIVPSSGDRAASVSWHLQRGALRVTPSAIWLPDSASSVPGAATVRVEGGTREDPLQFSGEVGLSGRPAAAFEINYRRPERQASLRGDVRPAGFAALRSGRPPGATLDGLWSESLGAKTTANLSMSASRLDLSGFDPAAVSSRAELRHQLTSHWSVGAAVGGGAYRGRPGETLKRSTTALETGYEAANFGVTAQYRYETTSLADHGGHGGRLSLHGGSSGWRTSAFVDAQQQAPTLDLVLQDNSELARAVAELRATSLNPEDLLRRLRDNATLLAAQGVLIGPVRVNPLRMQGGLDVSWRGTTATHPEVGLRVVYDDVQGVVGGRRAFVGSLYANWRVFGDTDIGVSYARWTAQREGAETAGRDSVLVLVRTSFDSLSLPGRGSRAITGRVWRDDHPQDDTPAARAPLADVEVVLDRSRRTRTGSDGRYTFDNPGNGAHRVEAVLPAQPGAYFTTPSVLTLQSGGDGQFTLSFSGVHMSGTVRSDAGEPIAGVTVRIDGPSTATAITDSGGVYQLAVPSGDARLQIVAETVPPGYDVTNLPPRSRKLVHDERAVVNFVVKGQRSVAGIVTCNGGKPAPVNVVELSRRVVSDAAGNFVLRGLPAGHFTLAAECAGGEVQQGIEIPAKPGVLRGVRLAVQ